MKNAFYFMIKALFVIKVFACMTSQTGQKIITIHILPNVSRNKGNQTINVGQLIEYNLGNIFLQNHAENEAGRLVPDLFCFIK